jgi:hypothetical protein
VYVEKGPGLEDGFAATQQTLCPSNCIILVILITILLPPKDPALLQVVRDKAAKHGTIGIFSEIALILWQPNSRHSLPFVISWC